MLPSQARIVVIGGGVLGTAAAFQLADSGQDDVLLIDKGPIASGTTPFAAGQTGYLHSDRFWFEFGLYNIEFFENFEERTGQPIAFHQTGSLRVALTEKYQADLERRVAAAAANGLQIDFLTPEQSRELVPTFEPPDDCRILLIPRDGYVEPKSVAVAYAAAAVERGVTIRTGVVATGLCRDGDRVTGVETAEGTIQAEWVVLAAGAWSRQFCRSIDLDLHAVPVRHQAYVTAPLAGVRPDQPIVRITEPQIYVRHEAGGLLVGGYGYEPMSFEMDDFPADFEIPSLEADQLYYDGLHAAAVPFFPSLAGAVRVQERRGLPTISPDGRLIIAEPQGAAGLVVVTSCGVGGIDRSPGTGRVVAEIIAGGERWIEPELLSAERFGDEFTDDTALRNRCVDVYAHHYHDVY